MEGRTLPEPEEDLLLLALWSVRRVLLELDDVEDDDGARHSGDTIGFPSTPVGHVGRVIARSATQATLTSPMAPRNTVVERFIALSLKGHRSSVDHAARDRGAAKRHARRQFAALDPARQIGQQERLNRQIDQKLEDQRHGRPDNQIRD